jgi:hypothetical protein
MDENGATADKIQKICRDEFIYVVLVFYKKYMALIASIVFLRFVLYASFYFHFNFIESFVERTA